MHLCQKSKSCILNQRQCQYSTRYRPIVSPFLPHPSPTLPFQKKKKKKKKKKLRSGVSERKVSIFASLSKSNPIQQAREIERGGAFDEPPQQPLSSFPFSLPSPKTLINQALTLTFIELLSKPPSLASLLSLGACLSFNLCSSISMVLPMLGFIIC